MFGKSITARQKPKARHPEPVPPLPVRAVLLATLATVASSYAIVRHYTRDPAPEPTLREIPAPELLPEGK